jgi:DNA-binding LytR/AlgR family response regulator
VLSRFAEPPALVFVSAYEDGAVGAFELDLHPLDYLMKPVSARGSSRRWRGSRDQTGAQRRWWRPQAATSGIPPHCRRA